MSANVLDERFDRIDRKLNKLTWMVGFVAVIVLANTGLVMGIAAKLFLH